MDILKAFYRFFLADLGADEVKKCMSTVPSTQIDDVGNPHVFPSDVHFGKTRLPK